MSLDCLIITSTEIEVNERMVVSDSISKRCCRRQCISWQDGKQYFYTKFLSTIHNQPDVIFTLNEMMSLSTLSLISYLRKNFIQTECIRFDTKNNDILDFYLMQSPKVVVIYLESATSALPFKNVAKYIRKHSTNSKLIISGKYIYNKYAISREDEWQTTMKTIGGDFYITNNMDSEILTIIRFINGEYEEDRLRQLYRKKGDEYIGLYGAKSEAIVNNIDWETLKDEYIHPIMYYSTSRGCPCKCSFCNFPIKNSNYQCFDIAVVEKQLDFLHEAGTKILIFMDDTMNLPIERFKNLLKMMIVKQYMFEWYCYLRIKECDEETIRLMSESGCKGVFLGLETANDNILQNMNKGTTVKDYEKGLLLLNKYNITAMAFFIVGFPGETEKTVQKTIKFIESGYIPFYTANLWYADPTTPVYQQKKEYGLYGRNFEWKHATMDSSTASYLTDTMLMNINNSVWIPNENFGFQGIPYMISKGYSIDIVIELLKQCKKLLINNISHDELYNRDKTVAEIKALLKTRKGAENIAYL